jgi:hypothetical protein
VASSTGFSILEIRESRTPLSSFAARDISGMNLYPGRFSIHKAWYSPMIMFTRCHLFLLLLLVLPACSYVENSRVEKKPFNAPGVQASGAVLLPNQWYLRPAGKQVSLGDFPVNIAVHPSGNFAAVLHCGWGPHEIRMVAIPSGDVICAAPELDAQSRLLVRNTLFTSLPSASARTRRI